MDGSLDSQTFQLRVREPVSAMTFDNPTAKRSVLPQLFSAEVQLSDNGKPWLVFEHGDETKVFIGWSFPQLQELLDEDLVRVSRQGRDFETVKELLAATAT